MLVFICACHRTVIFLPPCLAASNYEKVIIFCLVVVIYSKSIIKHGQLPCWQSCCSIAALSENWQGVGSQLPVPYSVLKQLPSWHICRAGISAVLAYLPCWHSCRSIAALSENWQGVIRQLPVSSQAVVRQISNCHKS